MAILPDFTLPSNPEITVRLREATVSDAIDFSGIDPRCNEEATTLFLERLQEKDKFSDPKKWTQQDRRFALFYYLINTTSNRDMAFTWTCSECSKNAGRKIEHTIGVPLADILNEYEPINGKPIREVIHNGHKFLVHPLLGADCEILENKKAEIYEKESKMRRKLDFEGRAKFKMLQLLCCVDIPELSTNKDETEQERRSKVEDFVVKMQAKEFRAFQEKVGEALLEMRHGLRAVENEIEESQIEDPQEEEKKEIKWPPKLESPPVFCPENLKMEGGGIRLHYPFRAFNYIPHV